MPTYVHTGPLQRTHHFKIAYSWGCFSIFPKRDARAAKPNCPRRSDVDAGAGDALCVNAPRGNGLRSGHAESRAAARR